MTFYVAATDVRDGHPAAVAALAFAGAASMGLMAVVNFTIRSAFRWLLLLFVLFALLCVAAAAAALGLEPPHPRLL